MTQLLDHLDRQVASARRLLGIVLAQGEAIRHQDVETLLARLADLQAEVATRHQLELERDGLIRTAATRLAVEPVEVDLDGLLAGSNAAEADAARARSAELRGLLEEVKASHDANRVVLRQELSFLDHLLRVLSGAPQGSYSATGWSGPVMPTAAAVDAHA